MKQSRNMSLIEALISTAVGFGISMLAQAYCLPLLGVEVTLSQNFAFALIMTVISIARQFVMRRLFEALHIRAPLSPSMTAVIAERRRQIEAEGWIPEHDDNHSRGQLAAAGGAYALHAGTESYTTPHEWPWSDGWWKPAGFRRDLVKAAALIVAEIDKFDRDRRQGRGR